MSKRVSFTKLLPGNQSLRTAVTVIFLGISLELLVLLFTYLIRQWGHWHGKVPSEFYHQLHSANSILGFVSTCVLVYGLLCFVLRLRISSGATRWLLIACGLLMAFKGLDTVFTVWRDVFYGLLKEFPFLDVTLANVFFVGSAIAILIGLLRALYDMRRAYRTLESQNTRLDEEVKEHQKAEVHARTHEEQLSTILNALTAPVLLLHRNGVVVSHNKNFGRLWGKSRSDYVGLNVRDFVPSNIYETGRQASLRVFESGEQVGYTDEYAGRTYDVNIYPVNDAQNGVVSVTLLLRDVTEKMRAEQELRLLETVLNNAVESILITDAHGHIVYVNPAFETQTGYPRLEVMGRTPSLLKSGKQDGAFYRNLWETITRGDVWSGQFVNRRKDGDLFHESATIQPIINNAGEITHYVAAKRNVTRELQLEQQLQQVQKLEALGTLAGGIAHDMNNVLAIILGRSELTLQMLDANHPGRESLEIIIRTATRSSELIKRLLSFTRKSAGEITAFCAAPLIREQTKFLRTYLPSNIRISEEITADLEIVVAEPSEVQQVFMNLVNNANHAMQPAGGDLDIGLDPIHIDEEQEVTTGKLVPGDYIRLRVSDTGCGIDSETLKHVFHPFFTTKKVGDGAGLGLSMIHGSVLRVGGQIDVESAPQKGTRMDIYWPRAASPAEEEAETEAFISGEGICVLVVDDLVDYTDLLTLNLEYHGFNVKAFSEPEKAVAFFSENSGDVDIALVDYMMPGMNGKEVARLLHVLRPDLPIVLLSGYACGITSDNAYENGFSAILEKPVEVELLCRELSNLAKPE